ncbi:MAG TPA: NAD(P)-dependent oxidoreductase [Candidatus Bathyarchaeia archaeon]|nr:NAD(P)-dependent oxidoreductase [Candidatus Bathyarchaeia archaeon]
MRVLVTGAAGFIGQHTVSGLNDRGYEVTGIDKRTSKGVVSVDITDFNQVLSLFESTKPQAVIHLAAISGSTGKNEIEQSKRQPYLNFHVNVIGTLNVCEASRMTGVRTLIYLSSFAVYGRTGPDRLPIKESTPTLAEHAYAVSKLAGEEIARTYGLDFDIKTVVFRAPFIVGERQVERNMVREFIDCAIRGENLQIYGQGTHVRDFLHPSDLVDAFARALESADALSKNELFVLGNKKVAVQDLASKVVSRLKNVKLEYISVESDRAFDQFADYTKCVEKLGWQPRVSIDEIIDRVVTTDYSRGSAN